jgi:hypothetical protein
VQFYKESAPNKVSFIDTGRLIRVFRQDDDTLLAALRLAQEKWGGVKINGTDGYKRKCAEIAARNGIRVSNPELSEIMKESERKTRPPMSVETARKTIEAETRLLEARHWKTWDSYKTHKKMLESLAAEEPEKPKILGVKKWRTEHAEWESERDRLLELVRSDLESFGVKHAPDGADVDKARREAAIRHERCNEHAAEEALRLHPDAAVIIREDYVRREREERTRREAEEAKSRIEEENYKRFRASIRELAKRFGKEALIITNAFGNKTYGGLILGTVERNDHHYAAQLIDEGRVILHNVEKSDLYKISELTGKDIEIRSVDGDIAAIVEERERHERNRGWSR